MDVNIDDIYKWIDGYTISRQIRNIEEDFSDAVPLAEILKNHFPKLVDLHSYNSKKLAPQKVVNWIVLNKKVLNKLNINLTPETIDKLAKSTPGVIGVILFQIKTILQNSETKKRKYVGSVCGAREAAVSGLTPVEGEISPQILCNEMVISKMYEVAKKDIEDKDHQINFLRAKVIHLESLLTIKDDRIKNLQDQVQQLSSI